MRGNKAIVTISLFNTIWYFWGFYLFMYAPGPRFGNGMDFYATLFLVGFFLFWPFTLFLIVYYVIFFITSDKVRWKVRAYAILFGALIPLLLGSIHKYWWDEVPPMSEQKAIQKADKEMEGYLKNNYKREIYWDRGLHEWAVIYRETDELLPTCEAYRIHRLYTIRTGGSCTEVLARYLENE
ncbi:hypothetical protein [Paenibacillus curdlanolyticus]|nr:hypothetical protein [Paenibacillus curdlanolyticus]